MSKRAILFSTRFLEYEKGFLFSKNCNKSKIRSRELCSFFLHKGVEHEVKEFFKQFVPNDSDILRWNKLVCDLKGYGYNYDAEVEKEDWLDEVNNKVYDDDKKSEDERVKILKRINDYYDEVKNADVFGEPEKLINNENFNIDYLRKTSLKINIGNKYRELPNLYIRFLIYKLVSESSGVDLFAVWCLDNACDNKEQWFDALSSEVVSWGEYSEIILMLHDSDVYPNTPFKILEYKRPDVPIYLNNKGIVEEKKVIRTIAVFQHSGDVGSILQKENLGGDNVATEIDKLLEKEGFLEKILDISHLVKEGAHVDVLCSAINEIKRLVGQMNVPSDIDSELSFVEQSLLSLKSNKMYVGDFKYEIICIINSLIKRIINEQ